MPGDPTPLIVATTAVLGLLVLALVVLQVRAELDRHAMGQRLDAVEATAQLPPLLVSEPGEEQSQRLAAIEHALADLGEALVNQPLMDEVQALGARLTDLGEAVDLFAGRAERLDDRITDAGERWAAAGAQQATAAGLLAGRVLATEAQLRGLTETHSRGVGGVPGLTDALRDKGEADDALDRRLTFLEGVTTAQGQSLSTMTESVGVAVAGFRGLAVHSGPEHTPDLYVFARQNVDGVPKETWRCHHCMYRELRDASATERTDLYRPAPEPILDPNTQQTSATSESSVRPRTVVASGEGLVDAMRRRR